MKDKAVVVLAAIIVIIVSYGFYYYLNVSKEGDSNFNISYETIDVYFNDTELNPNAEDCGAVFPVGRKVPKMNATPRTALQELFKGPKDSEKELGYTSWFSQETADILKSIKIEDKTAYVDLEDIRGIIPGASSSCGSQQLLAEIETTLRQFSSIERVIIAINGQPSTFYEWIQVGCTEGNDFCDEAPFQDSEEENGEEPDFSETGNLTINAPGATAGVWYLVYDEPGAPGVNRKLEFSSNSSCYIEGAEVGCAILNEDIAGARVEVIGFEDGGIVTVKTLKIIDEDDNGYISKARNWIENNAPTYLFDGMNLIFVETRALDLVDCEDCYEVEFTFESRQAGYGDRTEGASAQVITPHTIVVFIEDGAVTRVITDGVYNEMTGEMMD